ncbi:very short patch repair endonuclease [Glycomyces sp. YM15]|uniref:very short patch repair endonuclease n=1 Tax=Glycomyces sp. YM15 TaxID=2800446 RepID=UPI001F065BB7|nr:very short patch repair endonuclease [Glycomyces sp. YM15]
MKNLVAAWRMVEERRLLGQSDASRPTRVLRPAPVSENTRTIMRANKSKDTKPERLLRSAVHARGLRYRIHHRPVTDLRRTADLVFTRAKVAVFVDGCFWHGCPEHYRPAQRNSEFWNTKIETNMRRDSDTRQKLEDAGWLVIRVWEHEPVEAAADLILERVDARRTAAESARADESRQSP